MGAWPQDLRNAVRSLRLRPGYFITAVITLALGIGFTTAIFSVVESVLLKPLPYADARELLWLRERRLPQFPEFSVSPGHYLAWRDQTTSFESVAAWGINSVNLDLGNRQPERVRADRATANLFPMLRVTAALGRGITEGDDVPGAPAVAVLSYGTWQRRFGGQSSAIGRVVTFDRKPVTVVGVMPAGFAFPSQDTEMWIPMQFTPEERTLMGSHYLAAAARMKPGVSVDRARDDLETVAARLAVSSPDSSKGWDVLAFRMQDYLVRDVKPGLLVLLGAVSLVLLIGCVNVANLLLVRGAARQKELAIRSAIGSTRGGLLRLMLVEQFLVALAAAASGLLVSSWLLRGLLRLLPGQLPGQSAIGVNLPVLGFALGLAVITPLLFGLFPALRASRVDTRELLSAGGRQGGAVAGRAIRQTLVVAEIALAVMLLVGATLLMRSFGKLQAQSPGFVPDHLVTASISIPAARYAEGAPREQFFGALLDRVRAQPGVTSAALSQSVPMLGDFVSSFEIEGRPPVSSTDRPTTNFYAVSPGYFTAMRIPLLRGRDLSPDDRAGRTHVSVINETMAQHYFPGQNPIGHRINVSQGPSAWSEIVGVVGDVKQYGLGDRTSNQVYQSYLQHPYFSAFSVVARTTSADPASVVPALRNVVHGLDADVPLARVRVLDQVINDSIKPQRFSAILIALFGGAALLLAAVGVYSVLSYTVGLRTQEFAIRMAHGADRSRILSLVLRGALSVTAIGVGLGLSGAWLLRRLIASLLFGISPGDVWTYALAGITLSVVALIASVIPALRATRVEPSQALRA